MKLFMPFTIMLASESFITPWPVAFVGFLFIVGAEVAFEVEPAGEGAAAAWDGACEIGVLFAPTDGGVGGSTGGDVLFGDGTGCVVVVGRGSALCSSMPAVG